MFRFYCFASLSPWMMNNDKFKHDPVKCDVGSNIKKNIYAVTLQQQVTSNKSLVTLASHPSLVAGCDTLQQQSL